MASATANTAGIGSGLNQLLTGAAVWGALVARRGRGARQAGSQGVLLAVIVLTPLAAFEVVAGLPGAAQALERVRQSAARIFEVVDAPDPVVDPGVALAAPAPPATLCVRGLRARYRADGPWALDGVDLDLCPGRRIAVIGASGAGKSTLAAVLTAPAGLRAGSVTLAGRRAGRPGRRRRPADRRPRRAGRPRVRHLPAGEPPAGPPGGRPKASSATHSDGPACSTGWRRSPSGSTPPSASTARACPAASASASRSPAPSSPTSRSSSSTSRASTSTRATADAVTADIVAVTEARSTLLITHRLAGLATMDEVIVLDAGRVVERGTHTELVAAGGPLRPPLAPRSRRRHRERRPREDPVRLDDHLPLPVRAHHDRHRLPRRDPADDVAPLGQPGASPAGALLRHAAA